MKKRLLATLLALCLVLGLIPGEAWASHAGNSGEVKLLSLSVTDSGGKVISLLDKGVSVSLGKNYSFSATFSNADQLGKVYITSTKGNETKYLEAYRDGSAYVTRGLFDGDANYVPGKISVEYTKKIEDIPITADVSWNEIASVLGNSGSVKIDSSSGDSVKATVDISELLKSEWKELIDFSADSYDEITDGNLSDWLGAYKDLDKFKKYLLDDGAYTLYLDDSDSSTYAMILRSSSGNTYTKLILKDMSDSFDSMSKVAENISSASKVTKVMADVLDINKEASALRQEISNSTISSDQKQQLNQHVDNYECDRSMFTVLMAVLPAVAVASGGTMTGPALVFNAIISVINGAADTFWDYRIGMIRGSEMLDVAFSSDSDCDCGVPLKWGKDGTITESGSYYYPDYYGHIKIGTDDKPVNVTLCLHGHWTGTITINSGSVLHLRDCTYSKDNPNKIGAEVINIKPRGTFYLENGAITGRAIDGGRIKGITCDGGEIIICGGDIRTTMSATNNSRITVYDGKISSLLMENSELSLHNGSLGNITATNSEVTIRSGAVNVLTTNSGSTIYITSGQFGAIKNNGGNITIDGGEFTNRWGGSGYIIVNGRGSTLTIRGGMMQNTHTDGGCIVNAGTLNIQDGILRAPYIALSNEGQATIHNGTFQGLSSCAISNSGNMTITDGVFFSEKLVVRNGKSLTISGGSFQGNEGIYCSQGNAAYQPNLTITGGSFQANRYAVYGAGDVRVSISGGTFQSSAKTIYAGSGEMTISGGVFRSADDAALDIGPNSAVIVTGGTFCGTYGISAIGTHDVMKATFSITPETNIKVDATESALFGFNYSDIEFKILAADNYIGGVTYYKSASDGGTKMTIHDAQKYITEHSYLPYMRLTADGVSTISNPGDLNGDGKVTMADVLRLARGAAGYVTLTEQEQKAGDVNRDGKITMADVIRIARYAAGYSPAV